MTSVLTPARSALGGTAVLMACACGVASNTAILGGSVGLGALFWSGMAAIAVSAFLLGGWRAAVWVPVGAAVIRFGPDLLRLAGDWIVTGANLRSYAAYLVTIAGAGTLMYALAVGYRRATEPREETLPVGVGAEPAIGA